MKVIIGSDHGGFHLKTAVIKFLEDLGYTTEDVGTYSEDSCDYPVIASKLTKKVLETGSKGILICGTGIGMAITANKVPGIRAAVAHDIFSLERMIKSNNCQVLCMGARIIAPQSAELLLDRWLEIEFKDGPSTPQVEKIMEIENEYR